MSERASGWLLVVLVLAQLALLAAQVPDPRGDGRSQLEGYIIRVVAVPARWVTGTERIVIQAGRKWRSRARLEEENARLESRVEELERELIRLHGIEAEAERLAGAVRYARSRPERLRSADVVYADHSSWLRALVLRVAEGSGVRLNSPVVVPEGLVGRVVVASGSYAKVQLVTDRAANVGAMIERSRRQGVVRGQGSAKLAMDYLPLRADVRPGDRVVTAGIDGIYPRGLPLGHVTSIEPRPGELFLRVELEPAVDFGLLDQVYLLDANPVPEAVREAVPVASP